MSGHTISPYARSLRKATIEAQLAVAYKHVWLAMKNCEQWSDQSLYDDLNDIRHELDRIVNSLLQDRKYRPASRS